MHENEGLATRDPLTGLWNRRQFDADLEAAVRQADRQGAALEPYEAIEDLIPRTESIRFKDSVDAIEAHFNAGEELFEFELTDLTTNMPVPVTLEAAMSVARAQPNPTPHANDTVRLNPTANLVAGRMYRDCGLSMR